jgi:hypothetical protein
MNRCRPLLAALQIVLLIAIQLAEGTGVHHCPMHDAGVGHRAPMVMAPHLGHQTGTSHSEHGTCHCMGVCCQATLVYAAPAPGGAMVAVEHAPPPVSPMVATFRDTVRLLPFAIGPPPLA